MRPEPWMPAMSIRRGLRRSSPPSKTRSGSRAQRTGVRPEIEGAEPASLAISWSGRPYAGALGQVNASRRRQWEQ